MLWAKAGDIMRPPHVLVRRAIVDPLWLPVAAALIVLLMLVAAGAGLAWPLVRRHRLPCLALFAAVYIFADASLVVAAAALWLRRPVAAWRDEELWKTANARLLRWAFSLIVGSARPLFGFQMELEEPPDAGRLQDRGLLVLARHGGPGDSFTLVNLLLTRYHRRPCIVLKESLRWDPGLDVVVSRLPSCFLPTAGSTDDDLSARLAGVARGLTGSDAMLIFPEGGNWTPRRHRRVVARLRRRHGRQAAAEAAANRHVLPPRPGGVLACLAARPDLDVIIVAHTGLDDLVSPAQVWRALPLTGRPMIVRWWHEPAQALPVSPDERYQWLQVQWTIVDSWIDSRKSRIAQEPSGPDIPRVAPPDGPSGELGADPASV
jgi:1-acyl-sn-glycerol-3-phosphate acyltransferase